MKNNEGLELIVGVGIIVTVAICLGTFLLVEAIVLVFGA